MCFFKGLARKRKACQAGTNLSPPTPLLSLLHRLCSIELAALSSHSNHGTSLCNPQLRSCPVLCPPPQQQQLQSGFSPFWLSDLLCPRMYTCIALRNPVCACKNALLRAAACSVWKQKFAFTQISDHSRWISNHNRSLKSLNREGAHGNVQQYSAASAAALGWMDQCEIGGERGRSLASSRLHCASGLSLGFSLADHPGRSGMRISEMTIERDDNRSA